jgi:signal recognition particle receptor subunit beta
MPTYNYKDKELIAKIVYYGPGRCGKTTNLQQIHAKMRPETRSELLSVATETDRTIYFDLLPLNLGTINGMKFMVRLFTVPGQVYYSETRKIVLRGADGVVFVADSQDHMADENRESLHDLKRNLSANGLDYGSIPLVLQYNKRDLPRLIPEAELDAMLNDRAVRALSAVASRGDGVLETLRMITVGVFNGLKQSASPTAPKRTSTTTARPPAPPTPPADDEAASLPALGASASPYGPGAAPPTPAFGSSASPYGAPGSATLDPSSLGAPPTPQPRGVTRTAALDAAREAARTSARAAMSPSTPVAGPGQAPLAPAAFASPPAAMGAPAGAAAMGAAAWGAPLPPPPIPRGAGLPPLPGVPVQAPMVAPMASPPSPRPLPPPATIGIDLLIDEFRNLAAVQSQLAERMMLVEQELRRLGRENQELRELIASQHG